MRQTRLQSTLQTKIQVDVANLTRNDRDRLLETAARTTFTVWLLQFAAMALFEEAAFFDQSTDRAARAQ